MGQSGSNCFHLFEIVCSGNMVVKLWTCSQPEDKVMTKLQPFTPQQPIACDNYAPEFRYKADTSARLWLSSCLTATIKHFPVALETFHGVLGYKLPL